MLGLVLRLHDFAFAPAITDAVDEYSYAWAGVRMLRGHLPSGASALSAYGHGTATSFLGLSFRVVTPWLDHQPLFALLPGLMETITGGRDFNGLTLESLRVPSVVLGVATVLLGYSLARRLLPPIGAMLAAFLLAAEPGLVLLSRVGVAEAAVAPLLIWTILLCTPKVPESQHQGSAGVGPAPEQAPTTGLLITITAVCVIAPLISLTGLVVPVTAAGLLFARGLRRDAIVAAGAGVAGIALLLVADLLMGGGLIFSVWGEQLSRGGGILSAVALLTTGLGAGRPFVDAWYLFAWLALAYLAGNAKRRHRFRPLLWPIAAYLLVVAPFVPLGEMATYGWYRLPALPLLLIAAAAALYAAVREGQLLLPALAVFTAGMWSIQWLFPSPWRPGALTLFVLGAAAMVPVALAEVTPRGALRDAAQGVWAVLGLLTLAGITVLSWNLVIHLGDLG